MLVRRASLEPTEFGGLRIFDYTATSDLGSSVAWIEVPGGAEHAEAWSKRSEKFYLVIHGVIAFRLKDEEFELSEGDLCHVERGEHFSYKNKSGEPATLVLVHTPSFDLSAERFVE